MIALLLVVGVIQLNAGVIALTNEVSAECPKGTRVAQYYQPRNPVLEICWSNAREMVVLQTHDGRVIGTISGKAVQ